MPGKDVEEGPLCNRPFSLWDSPEDSELYDKMENLDTLDMRPGNLGRDSSPDSVDSCSGLDKHFSRMETSGSPDKVIDELFDFPEKKEYFSDPTGIRKRLEDSDASYQFLSEPSPNKKTKYSGERRRGRPRKEEISENEDLRTVAKRMYARAYRENMKSKYVETEHELHRLKKEYADLKIRHEKLEKLVEQCNFCTSSWTLVKSMNIDPAVLRMAYDTLSNIKSNSSSPPRRPSSTSSQVSVTIT